MLHAVALGLALLPGIASAQEAAEPPMVEGQAVTGVSPSARSASHEPSALLARMAALEARLAALETRTSVPSAAVPVPSAAVPVAVGLAAEHPSAAQGVAAAEAGSAVLLGGTVVASGDEVAEAVALTGPLDIHGTVLGNAVALAGPVRVHRGAQVLGDAVTLVGSVEVEEGGRVAGEQVSLVSAVSAALLEEGLPKMEGLLARSARRVAALLSLAATGVLLMAFWPRQVGRIAEVAMERPFWHGIAGLVLASVALVTGLFLAVTLVGIPVAGLLALTVTSAWLFGFVSLCFAIGDRLAPRPVRGVHWRTFLVGVVVVAALSLVPVLGPVTLALLGLVSIGAAAVSRFGNRMDADAP